MTTYVNEKAFFEWYREASGKEIADKGSLLEKVRRQYLETGSSRFLLPASETRSGQEKSYTFRYEDVGCCGASTVFIYF